MRDALRFVSYLFATILVLASAGLAQMATPAARILGTVNDNAPVLLKGSLHPAALAQKDAGRMPADTRLGAMSIVFSRSATQQADLDALISAQQNSASPLYHKWLTPEEFGARFGMAQSDIDQAKAWLEQQGFSVDSVSHSRSVIHFSGTVGQVEQAFHTQMHYYNVESTKPFAPSTELSLPAAIAPAILAITGLNGFRPKPLHVHAAQPDFTSGRSNNVYFAPGDIKLIYDMNTLLSAGFNGKGQTIAIVGQSAINPSNIENFQKAAGLPVVDPVQDLYYPSGPSAVNPFGPGDEAESELDLEWAGAIAPGATLNFVYTGSTPGSSAFEALIYAIDSLAGNIISISYGQCEALFDQNDLAYTENLLQQAATQGQTVVAAAGGLGSTACYGESGATTGQQQGLAVTYPGSSEYVTSVGGSEISQADPAYYTPGSAYWAAQTPGSDIVNSALQYIPEVAWNDSIASVNTGNGLSAGGGGASAIFPKPNWQTGVPGIPNDGWRDVPDIALYSSPNYVPYLFCTSDRSAWVAGQQASCNRGFRDSATQDLTTGGGTNFAAPIFAGMVAIYSQQKGNIRQGLFSPLLYTLASDPTTYASAFHDITSGNNFCPSSLSICSGPATASYSAGVGYDQVTGLGSIDLNGLVLGGNTAGSATVTVTPAQTSISIDQSLSVAVGASGSGATPTGTVTLTSGGYTSAAATLSNGAYTFTIPTYSLAGGFDALKAKYSGDSNYAVSVGFATVGVYKLTPSMTVNASVTNIIRNQPVIVTGTVTGSGPTPGGTVVISGGGYTATTNVSGTGSYTFNIPGNSLNVGWDDLFLTYSGDANYSVDNVTNIPVTVYSPTLLTPKITVNLSSSSIDSGQPLNVTITVTGSGPTPTGTVNVSSGSFSGGGFTDLDQGSTSGTIPANSLAGGTDTLMVTYSGDTSYAAASTTVTVNVTQSTLTISATTPAVVSPGLETTSTVTASSTNNFSGLLVVASCTLNPGGPTNQPGSDPTCSFFTGAWSPASYSNLTISTTASSHSALLPSRLPGRRLLDAGAAILGLLVFIGIPSRRRSWQATLGVLVLLITFSCISACGGGGESSGATGSSSGVSGTAAGKYTFTVTVATSTAPLNPVSSTTFTVTVR